MKYLLGHCQTARYLNASQALNDRAATLRPASEECCHQAQAAAFSHRITSKKPRADEDSLRKEHHGNHSTDHFDFALNWSVASMAL